MSIDVAKTLATIAKLQKIKPESELEVAVISQLICSHTIAVNESLRKLSLYTIANYTAEEYSVVLESLNNRIGELKWKLIIDI